MPTCHEYIFGIAGAKHTAEEAFHAIQSHMLRPQLLPHEPMAWSRERDFLADLLMAIDKHREFKQYDWPDDVKHQAIQRIETMFSIMKRAEAYIINSATLPPELFDEIRMHPEAKDVIFPHILALKQAIAQSKGVSFQLQPKWVEQVAAEMAEKYPFLKEHYEPQRVAVAGKALIGPDGRPLS